MPSLILPRGITCLAIPLAIAALLAAPGLLRAEDPSFSEVRDLVRAKLAGVTEGELEGAALDGLLKRFEGRVQLLTNEAAAEMEATNAPLIAKAMILEDSFGYVRAGRVAEGLAQVLASTIHGWNSSNHLKGIILDLRFAGGSDLKAGAQVADLFLAKELPLLEWKGESARATASTNDFAGPAVLLINHATAGAAEITAAILREYRAAALIGSRTADRAMEMSTYKLKSGHFLKIATATPKVANGRGIPPGGVSPDIGVSIPEVEERALLSDPYKAPGDASASASSSSSRALRPRLNEAELVRLKRDGLDTEQLESRPPRSYEFQKPAIADPSLARALDLLKGLNVIKSSRTM